MESEAEILNCVVYVSTATAYLDDEEVEDLLSESRIKNERLEVTGLLLYYGEHFVQVLEGPRPAVQDIYKSIRNDSRHHKVTTMVDEPIAQRFFPDWSMAYRRSPKSIPDENAALQKLLGSRDEDTIETVRKVFEIFGCHFGIGKGHGIELSPSEDSSH